MMKGLREHGAILLRHCPAQLLTPPPLLYSALAELFGLPRDVLMTYRCADVKNDSGYIPSNEPGEPTVPGGWHIVSESRKTVAGYSASVWPVEAPRVRRILSNRTTRALSSPPTPCSRPLDVVSGVHQITSSVCDQVEMT